MPITPHAYGTAPEKVSEAVVAAVDDGSVASSLGPLLVGMYGYTDHRAGPSGCMRTSLAALSRPTRFGQRQFRAHMQTLADLGLLEIEYVGRREALVHTLRCPARSGGGPAPADRGRVSGALLLATPDPAIWGLLITADSMEAPGEPLLASNIELAQELHCDRKLVARLLAKAVALRDDRGDPFLVLSGRGGTRRVQVASRSRRARALRATPAGAPSIGATGSACLESAVSRHPGASDEPENATAVESASVAEIADLLTALGSADIPLRAAEREDLDRLVRDGEYDRVADAIRRTVQSDGRSWAYVRVVLDSPPPRSARTGYRSAPAARDAYRGLIERHLARAREYIQDPP